MNILIFAKMEIRHINTILALALLPFSLIAQQPFERAVMIETELQGNNIILNWNYDETAEKYYIFSRDLDDTEWGDPLIELDGDATSHTFALPEGTTKTFGIFKSDPFPYRDTIQAEAGNYEYLLQDQFDKGLCCNFGPGYFLLTNGSDTLIHGTDFLASQDGTFTLAQTSTLYLEIRPDLFGNHLGWNIKNSNSQEVISEFGPLGTYLRRAPSLGMITVANKYSEQIRNEGILVLIEESLFNSLQTELAQMRQNLVAEGYRPRFLPINSNSSTVASVKATIQQQYNQISNLTTVYLLGHIPVPYSGDMYPDTHTDIHWGAWAADPFYGDLDGEFTDETVTQLAAFFERNKNIPGDGKYDQSQMPSSLELIVGRTDFYDLTDLSDDEETLTRDYLNKVHEWKVGNVSVQNKGLIDDNFGRAFGASASNGWRNMGSLLGPSNVEEKDFLTTLTQESHLWAFGCGSGHAFSCEGVAATEDFETNDIQAVFLMTFGSSFGDFDSENNFLRSPLTSGLVLNNSWVGNPHWFYQQMGIGKRIGEVSLKNMNSHYLPGPQLMHMSLMGDPTVDQYPIKPLEILSAGNVGLKVELLWNPGASDFDQYQIYHRTNTDDAWNYLATETSESYTHQLANAGFNEWLVIPEKLLNTNSGCFYKKGLGAVTDADLSGVSSINNPKVSELTFYPNPTSDLLTIPSLSRGDHLRIINSEGKIMYEEKAEQSGDRTVQMSNWPSGIYLIDVEGKIGKLLKTSKN